MRRPTVLRSKRSAKTREAVEFHAGNFAGETIKSLHSIPTTNCVLARGKKLLYDSTEALRRFRRRVKLRPSVRSIFRRAASGKAESPRTLHAKFAK